jgi:hypothetical protein
MIGDEANVDMEISPTTRKHYANMAAKGKFRYLQIEMHNDGWTSGALRKKKNDI